jgi:hypothetical protein
MHTTHRDDGHVKKEIVVPLQSEVDEELAMSGALIYS